MRRVAPLAVVAVLLASAYPLLWGQELPKGALPNPATSGAIVMEEPVGPAPQVWEYEIYPVGGTGRGREMLKVFNDLGRKGWEYADTIQDGRVYLFKRPAR